VTGMRNLNFKILDFKFRLRVITLNQFKIKKNKKKKKKKKKKKIKKKIFIKKKKKKKKKKTDHDSNDIFYICCMTGILFQS